MFLCVQCHERPEEESGTREVKLWMDGSEPLCGCSEEDLGLL